MSLTLLFALALFAQDAPAAPPTGDAPVADAGRADLRERAAAAGASSAPTDDFGFAAWCSGALDGYLEMKPRVLPEVRRIEGAFREPGRTLAQDMRVYEQIERDGRANRLSLRKTLDQAERGDAGLATERTDAYAHGRAVWSVPDDAPKARLAQEWMSWTLPGRCDTTLKNLGDPSGLLNTAARAAG